MLRNPGERKKKMCVELKRIESEKVGQGLHILVREGSRRRTDEPGVEKAAISFLGEGEKEGVRVPQDRGR